MLSDAHRLYWCRGYFQVTAIIKGQVRPANQNYVWADTRPGCKLWDDDPALIYHRFKTRVWFLRQEGEFLRPTFDAGTYLFLGLLTRWDDGPQLPPRQRLGTMLLTPKNNAGTLEEYASYIWEVGDIACELLGNQECTRRIDALAQLGNATLREAACGFLMGQLHQLCH